MNKFKIQLLKTIRAFNTVILCTQGDQGENTLKKE